MSRFNQKTNSVSCKYCGQCDLYWQKTAKSWMLVSRTGVHKCSMRADDGNIKKPPIPYEFDHEGNRVYEDIGYTPLPRPSEPVREEHDQAKADYESWAALQAHLNKILE